MSRQPSTAREEHSAGTGRAGHQIPKRYWARQRPACDRGYCAGRGVCGGGRLLGSVSGVPGGSGQDGKWMGDMRVRSAVFFLDADLELAEYDLVSYLLKGSADL